MSFEENQNVKQSRFPLFTTIHLNYRSFERQQLMERLYKSHKLVCKVRNKKMRLLIWKHSYKPRHSIAMKTYQTKTSPGGGNGN